MGDIGPIGDGHDNRVGQGTGIECDSLVLEDRLVGVQGKWKDGRAEGRYIPRYQPRTSTELLGGGKSKAVSYTHLTLPTILLV